MAKNINFALVEDVRHPIYTAMKYWGKKPHNIWRTYIEADTPKNGVYLDLFAGSAISAFEAIKAGRKAIAFDLNPLTSFIVEVFTTKFDRDKFRTAVNAIVSNFDDDLVYNEYFTTESRKTKGARTGVEYYSDKENDLGNLKTYENFIEMFRMIMLECFEKLRNGKYCTIVVSDFTVDKKEKNTQGDIVAAMEEIRFEFCGTTVLLQNTKPLYPFGYPYAYKINHHHQNMITIRKPKDVACKKIK